MHLFFFESRLIVAMSFLFVACGFLESEQHGNTARQVFSALDGGDSFHGESQSLFVAFFFVNFAPPTLSFSSLSLFRLVKMQKHVL